MTVRSEILAAAESLRDRGLEPFSPADAIQELRRRGCSYPETTIRTYIVSVMCINAPRNHAIRYPDLERVGHGQYRLTESAGAPPEGPERRTPANERSHRRDRAVQWQILTAIDATGGSCPWPPPGLPVTPDLTWQLDDLRKRAYLRRTNHAGDDLVTLTPAGRSAARTGSAESSLARRTPLQPFELELLHQLMWEAADPAAGEQRRRYDGGIKWILEEHFGVETKDKAGPHGQARNDALQRLESIGVIERIGGGEANRTPNCWVTDPGMVSYPW